MAAPKLPVPPPVPLALDRMGLPLCREIVEAHGDRISLRTARAAVRR